MDVLRNVVRLRSTLFQGDNVFVKMGTTLSRILVQYVLNEQSITRRLNHAHQFADKIKIFLMKSTDVCVHLTIMLSMEAAEDVKMHKYMILL